MEAQTLKECSFFKFRCKKGLRENISSLTAESGLSVPMKPSESKGFLFLFGLRFKDSTNLLKPTDEFWSFFFLGHISNVIHLP